MTSREVSLSANDTPVELNSFVQGFIDHIVGGILAALRGTGDIKDADILIEGDTVVITLNEARVPINPFVTAIIRNTIVGMVSSLEGISEAKSIHIHIRR